MKRVLNRLVVTDTEQEETDTTDDSDVSTSVAWTDLSTRTAGPIGTEERLDQPPVAPSVGPDGDLLLASVLDTIVEPTLLVDQSGEISHLNRAAREAFDTTDAEARGATPTHLHGGQQLAKPVCETGEPIDDYRETVEIAGESRQVSRTVTPLTDEECVVAAMETISLDGLDDIDDIET